MRRPRAHVYWLAYHSSSGVGAAEVSLSEPITHGSQLVDISKRLGEPHGIRGEIIITGFTLLRTEDRAAP